MVENQLKGTNTLFYYSLYLIQGCSLKVICKCRVNSCNCGCAMPLRCYINSCNCDSSTKTVVIVPILDIIAFSQSYISNEPFTPCISRPRVTSKRNIHILSIILHWKRYLGASSIHQWYHESPEQEGSEARLSSIHDLGQFPPYSQSFSAHGHCTVGAMSCVRLLWWPLKHCWFLWQFTFYRIWIEWCATCKCYGLLRV